MLDRIVDEWVDWARTATDVGIQTRRVLKAMAAPTEAAARDVARAVHESSGRSGGNGSLMRTGPLALAYLDDPAGLALAARRVSDLTHFEADTGDACVLWCLAIRSAVLDGTLDVRVGLTALPVERRDLWAARLDEAEAQHPRDFDRNGWVVQALQGAWSAITHGSGLVDILERAVRGGRDTDTVAAIAGALAGASFGSSAVPSRWRRIVHGWSGLRARGLIDLGVLAANAGLPDRNGWPSAARFDYSDWGDVTALVRHPHDDGVWLGAVGALDIVETDAVVSLCRVGGGQARVPAGDHVEVWLVDDPDPAKNLNLDLVLADAADAVAAFRAEGKTVLLHCVQAQSRTPSVGALYAARHLGVPIDDALAEAIAALPDARPKEFLLAAVRRVAAGDQ
ncbi:hypothetical protein ABIB15_000129 [Marisediminicola sp. UYEF4]|uniref:ADP-ribosylglycohydrolase family protein n=1 Tax=Marisediminicola sp. UYEF4 TaxID=1756384 RepID=UPI00339AF799